VVCCYSLPYLEIWLFPSGVQTQTAYGQTEIWFFPSGFQTQTAYGEPEIWFFLSGVQTQTTYGQTDFHTANNALVFLKY
jgi:hypothetical protein